MRRGDLMSSCNLRRLCAGGTVCGLGVILALAAGRAPATAQAPAPDPQGHFVSSLELPEGVPADAVFHLPQVYVTGVRTESVSPEGIITGSFTIENRERSLQSGLHYQIQLLGLLPPPKAGELQADLAPEFDRTVSRESVSILPGATKQIPFRYQAPRLPENDYRLRVRLITEAGRQFGWYDLQPVRLGTPGVTFVLFEHGPMLLPDQRTAFPDEGANVEAGATIVLRGVARNRAAQPLTVTPHLAVYRWDITGERVEEKTTASQVLPPESATAIEVPVVAGKIPDAYHVVFTLRDATGARVSNELPYRFVVKGIGAKVVTAAFETAATTRGTTVVVAASVVGPADRGETTAETTTTVEILDGTETIGEQSLSLRLDGGIQPLKAQFILPRDVARLGLRVTIRDSQGNTLDRYEAAVELTPEERSTLADRTPPVRSVPRPALLGALAGVLLLLALLLTIHLWRRRPPPSGTVTLLLLLAVSLGVAAARDTAANGILILKGGPAHWISVFINHPNDGFAYRSDNVPFAIDMNLAACNNAVLHGRVIVRYNATGGHHLGSLPSPREVFNHAFSRSGCGWGASHATCILPFRGFNGSFNAGPIPHTTVQTHGLMQLNFFNGSIGRAEEIWHTRVFLSTPPLGRHEAATCAATTGWTCDPNNFGQSTKIHVYVDAPSSSCQAGTVQQAKAKCKNFVDEFTANQSRPDIASLCGGNAQHGFSIPIPTSLKDGKKHSLFVYAIDDRAFGIPADNPLLEGSPKSIQCTAQQSDLVLQDVTASGNLVAGQTVTLSGTVKNTGSLTAGPSVTSFTVDDVSAGTTPTGTLDPAATEKESLTWVAVEGSHTLAICADAQKVITEADENNNCGQHKFTVTPAAAPPAAPSPTPEPTSAAPLLPGGFKEQQP